MEEGVSLFDARSASLGHTLQGGIPSPLDRSRAVRLASKCMTFIEEHARAASTHRHGRNVPGAAIPEPRSLPRRMSSATAAMITIQGTSVKFASVQDVVQYADMKNRRALNSWWRPYKDLAEELGGLPQLQHS